MKFIVTVPDGWSVDPHWAVTRSILDRMESGASGHCLLRTEDSWEHARLGVTVRALRPHEVVQVVPWWSAHPEIRQAAHS